MSEKEQVKIEKAEAKDAVTKIPKQKTISNDLEENVKDDVEDIRVSHKINPQMNEVLTATTGPFRESRRIRGGAKNQKVPFLGAVPLDDVERVSAPTGKPNWETVNKYTPMYDDEPHDSLAPTYTTVSIFTSSGTTKSTKKRVAKRKPVLTQSSTTTVNGTKNEVPHFSQVATQNPDHPSEPMKAEPPTPLLEDVGPVSVETDDASEELAENRPNSKKIQQSLRIKGTVHVLVTWLNPVVNLKKNRKCC